MTTNRRSQRPGWRALTAGSLALCAFLMGAPVSAQPMTERSPNVEGTWTTPAHVLHFQFSHRFEVAGSDVDISDLFGPDGKVVNYPTFSLTYGLFEGAHLGVRYSSNSVFVGQANEWELNARITPLRGVADGRLSLGLTGAWNTATSSFDGEAAVQADIGLLRLIGAGRVFSNPFDRPVEERSAEFAFAGAAVLRLNRFISLAGDYANMVTQSDAQVAWSAGAAIGIPSTPHTLALFATNVASGTLQGRSVGIDGAVYWGFEFTIPFTGPRWGQIFNPPAAREPPPAGPAGAGVQAPATGPVVEIEVSSLKFQTEELRIAPGTTVRWVNQDPVAHTSTSVDGLWASPLVEEGGAFQHTFPEPGRFEYYCVPHPFMTGVIIVTDGNTDEVEAGR